MHYGCIEVLCRRAGRDDAGTQGDRVSPTVPVGSDPCGRRLDINRISVDAEPFNPSAPSGETKVTVRVRFRGDISGVYGVWMYLCDPQGGMHRHRIYLHYLDGEDGERGIYPGSDPTKWTSFERVVILPPGSLPGIWGIAEINVEDRAKNLERYTSSKSSISRSRATSSGTPPDDARSPRRS